MKKIIKFIKVALLITALIFALGYCGQIDSEYEQQRAKMINGPSRVNFNYDRQKSND